MLLQKSIIIMLLHVDAGKITLEKISLLMELLGT